MSREIEKVNEDVAVKVMGWTLGPTGEWLSSQGAHPHTGYVRDGVFYCDLPAFSPSTDPAAAMQVVERMYELKPEASVTFGLSWIHAGGEHDGPCATASIEGYDETAREAYDYFDTIPIKPGDNKTAAACLALCLAALRAVGGEGGKHG